jgi:hypothetical protein
MPPPVTARIVRPLALVLAVLVAPLAVVAGPVSSASAAEVPPDRGGPSWIARLNQIRDWAGMNEVVESTSDSADSQAAAEWLVDNDLIEHDIEGRGAPEAAVRGAASSNLYGFPGGLISQLEMIDGWIHSFGHGVWMVHPGLSSAGYGEAVDSQGPVQGVAALHAVADVVPVDEVHLFPRDGVTDFDLTPGTAYDVIASTCGWAPDRQVGPILRVIAGAERTEPDPSAAATLTVNGESVEVCIVDGNDYEALSDADSLAIIPADPFPVGASVSATATWRGNHAWSFRTAGTATSMTRLAGIDRIATAVESSHARFPAANSASSVVLVRSDSFADALAGTPLSVAKNGPLLLTPSTTIDDRTRDEIDRVLPAGGTVYLLGGSAAIGASVEQSLRAAGYDVVRYAGADRAATAVAVAERGLGSPDTVLVADGLDFRDALVAGAAAAKVGGAVLLSSGAEPASSTTAYLGRVQPSATYLGSAAQAAYDAGPERSIVGSIEGVAVAVAERFFPSFSSVGVAGSADFPDALSGGAHAAAAGGPLLWTQRDTVPIETAAALEARRGEIERLYVYGGTAAVSSASAEAAKRAATPRWSGDRG